MDQQKVDKPYHPPPAPGPPKTLRQRFLHSLPHYTGPYNVGYLEIEAPAREPRAFSHIRRNHEPALRMDTVLFSVYYPCEQAPDRGTSLHTVPWLPRPRLEACRGYAKFLSVPNLPVTAYIACTTMFTKLPVFRNGKLAERWAPERGINTGGNREGTSEPKIDSQRKEDKGRPIFPVLIFSHGLGGSRTLTSSICGGLASYGVVVVAMEHRDGSGARTFVNLPPGKQAHRDLDDQGLDKNKEHAKREEKRAKKHPPKRQSKSYYKVDYLFPKDNPKDTSPSNPLGVDTELRGAQIEMRLAEIEEAYHILTMINDGRGEEVRRNNLRKNGAVGSCSKELDGIDWRDWKGRLHMENVTIAGHSFGGATSAHAVRLTDRFPWIGQGVLLDAWGPAMPQNAEQRIRKHILSIGSEAFMHWQENFDRLEDICREGRDQGALCWQMTIRGSTHLSQTDFAVLYPNWMALFMKTLVNPRRAMYLTIASILEFLRFTLPPQQRSRFETAWPNEHLLEADASDADLPFDHRPDEKWIASRLKIEKEFSLRLSYWMHWRRRWQLKREVRKTVPVPKVPPLGGLLDWDREIWMHLRPDMLPFSEDTSESET